MSALSTSTNARADECRKQQIHVHGEEDDGRVTPRVL